MFHQASTAKKYIVLFIIIFKCMIIITANPLTTDTVETVNANNEDKIAAPEELEPNVDDVSKTAAIGPSPAPTDDEFRSIKVDEVNDDSVTSEILTRTDFTPSQEVKEKRSVDIGTFRSLSDSDLRSDLDDIEMADVGPDSRKESDDYVTKSADDSVTQDQRSDMEDSDHTEQDIENKAATETDDSSAGRTDIEENNERVASTEESSDNVGSEDRDAEETVELDSATDGFIRGSRRMLESGDILETKGRSGENVDISRTVPTPDLRSLNALNPFGSSTSRRSFKSDIIVPHVHTILNSPSVFYPNVYGIPTVINKVASGEINPVSRSFPFRSDIGAHSQTHTHAHASAESNSANQIKSMEPANTYPFISTQNPMGARQLISKNVDILKKLTDASSLPIKSTLFSAENGRPYSNLFNPISQGFPPKLNQFSAPRIRRSVRKQQRFLRNL